jgi:hypothetical protein
MARRDRRHPPRGSHPGNLGGGDGRPPVPEPVRRSMAVVMAQLAYEKEMRQTPEGRRIDDLRQEAIAIIERGDLETAHGMFLAAVEACPQRDDGPLAAACRYDLAESFGRRRSGVELENVLEARRLFERTLRSPARQRTPLRLALTHDALGRILRRLSERGGPDEAALFEGSRANILRACEVVESCGPVGLVDAAGYRNNLGNLLKQDEQWDAAEHSYRLALRHWDAAIADPLRMALDLRPPGYDVSLLVLLGLSRAQHARGRREGPAGCDRSGSRAPSGDRPPRARRQRAAGPRRAAAPSGAC